MRTLWDLHNCWSMTSVQKPAIRFWKSFKKQAHFGNDQNISLDPPPLGFPRREMKEEKIFFTQFLKFFGTKARSQFFFGKVFYMSQYISLFKLQKSIHEMIGHSNGNLHFYECRSFFRFTIPVSNASSDHSWVFPPGRKIWAHCQWALVPSKWQIKL